MVCCTIGLHIMFKILYESSNSTVLFYSFLIKNIVLRPPLLRTVALK